MAYRDIVLELLRFFRALWLVALGMAIFAAWEVGRHFGPGAWFGWVIGIAASFWSLEVYGLTHGHWRPKKWRA